MNMSLVYETSVRYFLCAFVLLRFSLCQNDNVKHEMYRYLLKISIKKRHFGISFNDNPIPEF